jgi:alanyl-tRNA synthetase
MCIKIYERDAYVFEFEAAVTSVDREWVALDATAFYPGGGGQVNDLGKICGLDVTEVVMKGDDVLHRVPGHSMRAGDKIWCSVDWERRYDIMMGHTAEHLLFGALRREVPDIGIVKIFIAPESKYVIVDRDVGWDIIEKAQMSVNSSIIENLNVTKTLMDRNDPALENVRAKMERIGGDIVTVVEIGDADIAACGGMHVRETGEITALFVDRKVSAGKDGHAIHFRVGIDAIARSMELANRCLRMVEIIGTKPEDAVNAARNIKHDNDVKTEQLRDALSQIINDLRPETVNGVPIVSGVLAVNDRNIIAGAAERIKGEGGVAVLVAKGDTLSIYVSSGAKGVDCSAILKGVMTGFNGKGGGKADFAQGGSPCASDAEKVLNELLRRVKAALKQEN